MYTPKKRYTFNCPVCHHHGYVRNTRQNIRYCVCEYCNAVYAINKNTGRIITKIIKYESEK